MGVLLLCPSLTLRAVMILNRLLETKTPCRLPSVESKCRELPKGFKKFFLPRIEKGPPLR